MFNFCSMLIPLSSLGTCTRLTISCLMELMTKSKLSAKKRKRTSFTSHSPGRDSQLSTHICFKGVTSQCKIKCNNSLHQVLPIFSIIFTAHTNIYIIDILQNSSTLQVTQFPFTLFNGLVLYQHNCWVCTNSVSQVTSRCKTQTCPNRRKIRM